MAKVDIPATIGQAKRRLASLEGIATATEWERAAIVAAFVREGGSQVTYSAHGFAALGIAGLRSRNTVRRYLRIWDAERATRPEPGTTVSLPARSWADAWDADLAQNGPTGGRPRDDIGESIREHPEKLAKALRDPAVRAVVDRERARVTPVPDVPDVRVPPATVVDIDGEIARVEHSLRRLRDVDRDDLADFPNRLRLWADVLDGISDDELREVTSQ
jgi:hypothetical protein